MAQQKRVPLTALGNVDAYRERVETVCLKTYDLDSVKETCYRFSPEGFHSLQVLDENSKAQICFRFPSTFDKGNEEALINYFHQDLLDQNLRKTIRERTEIARHLILANAFASTTLVDNEND